MHRLEERLRRQPQPTRGLPGCPRRLTGTARQVWEFWAAELGEMDLDARPDAMLLEGVCVHYARAAEADRMVETGGDGNPAAAISHAAWRLVCEFCSEFGFSPLSRTRLALGKPDKGAQELMEMLSRPREHPKPPP
jgi:P27 family predicted phage terminase small subunit